ncbi:TonB-dependent receptor domain-containing protein [Pseudoalteromonas sp. MTN2-4]|uniref:TonB-dependent receptor domain-containing protein n=1 Tax=Pseudoalteromonas sp. MTN2-4 TaxID=3056555 RepID=UPI0036F1BC40
MTFKANLAMKPAYLSVCVALACISSTTLAQQGDDKEIEKISVVGSNIKVNQDRGELPVTVMSGEDIAKTGAMTGAELLAEIPQMGEVSFNQGRSGAGVNDARGDVSSINLRGLGTGNTLTLLNGRRLVLHPGTQSEGLVPVTTVNSNTLPVKGLKQVEVLRDGAAAIYGSDAVAGVINYVLKDNYEGSELSFNYGSSEGTSQDQLTIGGITGFAFNDEKSHLTTSFNAYFKNGMMANEREYARSADLSSYPTLPEEFIGDTQLDNRHSASPWGEFSGKEIGKFHIRPQTMGDCEVILENGVCASGGSQPRDLRYNRNYDNSLTSDVERFNAYALYTQELTDEIELFGEALYYQAKSERTRFQAHNLSSQRFSIAADAYHNPFDELITVRNYRPVDAGRRQVEVTDHSYRLLTGLKGYIDEWDWESAIFHTEANSLDRTFNWVQASKFQAAINSTDKNTAYNIFTGGDINNVTQGDSSTNPQAVIDSFTTTVDRESKTTLSQWDFKISNSELMPIFAGELGFAAGVEYRHESYEEDRDNLLDTSSPFVDQNTGKLLTESDVLGNSPTKDSRGSRNVLSAYAEFYVPLVEDAAFAKNINLQAAARYERFSDVGDVLKPKLALSWEVNDWLQFRTAYAEGFRAPGLPQVVADNLARTNTRRDPVTGVRGGVLELRSGSDTLKPEDDINKSFGIVLKPTDNLLLTADWWQVKQENLVGLLSSQTHLLYDALLRSQGSKNEFVIRDENLEILHVKNDYANLNPRKVSGVDLSISYDIKSDFGQFDFKVNAARLLEFYQDIDAITATISAAQAAGNESILFDGENIELTGGGSLVEQNGRPKWRFNASMGWKQNDWAAGISARYVGKFADTSTNYADEQGELIHLPVESWTTVNAFVNHRFTKEGWLNNSKVTFGVRNLLDKQPPLADAHFGYQSGLHSSQGRYFYLSYSKSF